MRRASVTAALLIIGNEILSGRTQDVNLNVVARKVATIGIVLKEVRVVPDISSDIVDALNALRIRYTYVFTTGGIGPTHDDITVDAVAAAFGVSVTLHAEARDLLLRYYGEPNLTPARLRMARVPEGGRLIANPISAAPGIHIDNVYVMAGVPSIMQAMMDEVVSTLRHGPDISTLSVSGAVAESMIAEELRVIASHYPELDIGSYPWMRDRQFGTTLVTRGLEAAEVRRAAEEIHALVLSKGVEASLSEG